MNANMKQLLIKATEQSIQSGLPWLSTQENFAKLVIEQCSAIAYKYAGSEEAANKIECKIKEYFEVD